MTTEAAQSGEAPFEELGEPLRPDPVLEAATTTQVPPTAEEAIAFLEVETESAESVGGTAIDDALAELTEEQGFLATAPAPATGATSVSFGTDLVALPSQVGALAGPPSWGGEVTDPETFAAAVLSLANNAKADVVELEFGFDLVFPDGSTGQLRHEAWINWLYVAN